MKTIDSIPTSKINRASKLVQTGAKIGINYIKYYGDKIVNSEEDAKERKCKCKNVKCKIKMQIVYANSKIQMQK